MSNSEERVRILQMIAEGKITAAEGTRLLEVLGIARQPSASEAPAAASPWLHLRLSDPTSGQVKTEANIPLSVVQIGLKLGLRLCGDNLSTEVEQLVQALEKGQKGAILAADDNESGQRLEIFIE